MGRKDPAQRETARGLNDIENYLRSHTEIRQARSEAESFVAQLSWLHGSAREEVVRLYAQRHLDLARRYQKALSLRHDQLHSACAARYEGLRRRAVALTTLALLTTPGFCLLTYLSTHPSQ